MSLDAAILHPVPAVTPRRRLREALTPFAIDLRAVAAFRVVLALLLLARFATWAAAFVRSPATGEWSIAATHAAALGLLAVAGLALLSGWASRSAALLGLLATLMVETAGGLGTTPGNVLLRIALLWAALLPIGERFAIDTALEGPTLRRQRWAGAATVGVLLQFLAVYLAPPIIGDAADLRSITPLARGLEAQPWWRGSVPWTDLIEAVGFGALIVAFAFTGRARAAAAAMMATLHAVLGITLDLGLLHLVLAGFWLLLLPRQAWDWLERRLWTPDRLRVRLWHSDRDETQVARVRLLRTFLLLPPAAARPTSEDIDMDVFRRQRDSWVVTDARGYRYVKFRALSAAVMASPIFWPIGLVLHIGFVETIGDWVYDLTKRRRGPLVLLAARVTRPRHTRAHEALAAALLIGLLTWQLWGAGQNPPAGWSPWWATLRAAVGG